MNFTCEVNPPLPSNLALPIFQNCCLNNGPSLNSTQVLTNFICQSDSSSKELTHCISSNSKTNSVCTSNQSSNDDDMNSAQSTTSSSPRSIGWKTSVAASLLLVTLGLTSVSASPTTLVPNVRHKNGQLVNLQRIEGSSNMFMAQNTDCASLGVTDCFDAVYDVCPDSGCCSGCSCIIQHHSPNDAAANYGQTGSCYDVQPGDYGCGPFRSAGISGDVWVKMNPYKVPDAELVITRDQTCPPSGPNAVVASIHPDRGCVNVGTPEPSWGGTTYTGGGSPYKRSFAEDTMVPRLSKRNDCTMDVESQTDTYSTSKIVSETVDCRGKTSDCSIDVGKQHTETLTTTWSLESGFSDFGFSVTASFGGSYAESDTSTLQDSITVNAGAEGYLTYYVEATRFEGTFRNCDQDGQKGTVYALKSDSNPAVVHYAVVNTNR